MGFNKKNFVTTLFGCSLLTACSANYGIDKDDNYVIGNKPTAVSSLNVADGTEPSSIVIFDKTVRRIHQFDVGSLALTRSFEVKNPGADHYVLFGPAANYIVDMSTQGLSIFDRFGNADHNPIRYLGKPVSIAYNPALHLVVTYDDLMSVGLLQLNANGQVMNRWVGGGIVSGNQSIACGDLNELGQLVLALSDGSIVVVDVAQSIAQQKWIFQTAPFVSGLNDIQWLAPVPQDNDLVFVRSADKLAVIHLSSKQVDTVSISGDVIKNSKVSDPHVLIRSGQKIDIAYVAGGAIQTKSLYVHSGPWEVNTVLSSYLDLTNNVWSIVDTKSSRAGVFNDIGQSSGERNFKRYRLSDLLATQNKSIPGGTQVEVGSNFIFALFPSELGKAVRYDINSDAAIENIGFNKNYIPAN